MDLAARSGKVRGKQAGRHKLRRKEDCYAAEREEEKEQSRMPELGVDASSRNQARRPITVH